MLDGHHISDNLKYAANMTSKPKIIETLAINLKMLMPAYGVSKKELAIKSGISERMIGYILAGEKTATIQVADDLARAFRLAGWQIIMPNLSDDPAKNGRLEKLLENYLSASVETRNYIDSVAEREAGLTTGKEDVLFRDRRLQEAESPRNLIKGTTEIDLTFTKEMHAPDHTVPKAKNRVILIDKKRPNKR